MTAAGAGSHPRRVGFTALLAALCLLAAPGSGSALVKKGETLGDFTVVDGDEKPLKLSALAGRPILIIYEDRDTAAQNHAFKLRLNRLAKAGDLPAKFAVLPIADVRKFNFWPARQMARDQLKARSSEMGRVLFADWTGDAGKRIGAPEGQSVLVLVDADGKVLFSAVGTLASARQVQLMQLVKAQRARADAKGDPIVRPLRPPPPPRPVPPPAEVGKQDAAKKDVSGPEAAETAAEVGEKPEADAKPQADAKTEADAKPDDTPSDPGEPEAPEPGPRDPLPPPPLPPPPMPPEVPPVVPTPEEPPPGPKP